MQHINRRIQQAAFGCLMALVLGGCSATRAPAIQPAPVETAAASESKRILHAVGYAPIGVQTGATETERMLQAMQASKLDAYRELSEQLYGIQLRSETGSFNQSQDEVVITTRVAGTVRGARVVRSYPLEDIYVTEMELIIEPGSTNNAGRAPTGNVSSLTRNGGSF